MTKRFEQAQAAMAYAAQNLADDVRLEALAAESALSPFHLHRIFTEVAGETPKAYTTRLRLSRATALLLTTDHTVLRIALECGFESHEGFTRAFGRRFGLTPTAYRARGFASSATHAEASTHRELVEQVAPCLQLYRYQEPPNPKRRPMTYSIEKKDVDAQPVLVEQRRVSQGPEISQAIGEVLGNVFAYAQQHGIALTGQPFTRYPEIGPGRMTIEPGMRVASGDAPSSEGGDDGVRADTLPGGAIACTIHRGPYDKLHEAYAALEKWIEGEGLKPAGAPWEIYITDPTEVEDPEEWQTEVCWPVA